MAQKNVREDSKIAKQQFDNLLHIISRMPAASINEIAEKLKPPLSRRTLQRWLQKLVQSGQLQIEGKGRAARYLASPARKEEESIIAEAYIPISVEGESIKQYVRRPIQERRPVGYNRAFLDEYQPNKTAYVPSIIKEKLLAMGKSDGDERQAGTYARRILNRLLIDLSWNSSRLEGNTYSLLETETLLAEGQFAPGKAAFEGQMILNHKTAIEFLVESAEDIGFNRFTILNLHAMLADNLLANPKAGGRLRSIPVGISRTVYLPPEIPQLIEECFTEILVKADAINDPYEQAFFAMVHLPYLQPFEDVNKRVSRLAANIPFIKSNLCPLSFIDVPERAYVDGLLGVYERNDITLLLDVFLWAYERSASRYAVVRASLGEPDPFRTQYRSQIFSVVAEVVEKTLDKKATITFIDKYSTEHIPASDRAHFIDVVEAEISSLHEGNFARYRIRPLVFLAWQKVFAGKNKD